MDMLQMARGLANQVLTSSTTFNTDIVFVSADGETTATIKGLSVKHNLKFDEFGTPVSSKTARVTVSEAALVAANFPVRNGNNEVYLNGCLVTWTDSAGNSWTYVISSAAPDETLGLILCQITDYIPS
jgi:hypothetical protein